MQKPSVTVDQRQSIISYTQKETYLTASSTRKSILTTLASKANSLKLPANSVFYINMTDSSGNPADIQDLVRLLAPKAPQDLVRSLDEKYMFGVYSADTNDFFIILKETDYGIGYAGMLKWENGIVSDLGTLFNLPEDIMNSGGVFEDEALKNKDLRVIKDANRKTVFLYSFIDKNTILITTDENAFGALLNKYITNQITK